MYFKWLLDCLMVFFNNGRDFNEFFGDFVGLLFNVVLLVNVLFFFMLMIYELFFFFLFVDGLKLSCDFCCVEIFCLDGCLLWLGFSECLFFFLLDMSLEVVFDMVMERFFVSFNLDIIERRNFYKIVNFIY